MKRLLTMILVTATLGLTLGPAFAVDPTVPSQTTSAGFSIDIGQALTGSLKDIINAIATALIASLVGWVLWVIKSKFGVDLESQYRATLTQFLQRQASGLIAAGAVKLDGVKINVQSGLLAKAANTALQAIPDTMNYFKLSPDRIAEMIVDLIPKEPSVSAATAVALDAANPATPSKPA